MSRLLSSCRIVLAVLSIVCVNIASASANAACVLRVGWDEWPPFITVQYGQFQGIEYEMLKATADAADCELDMVQIPWARALKMLGDGELDLLYGAGYSAERAEFANYSIPYRQEQFVLVTRPTPGTQIISVSLSAWLQSPEQGDVPRVLGVFQGNFYGNQIEQILENNSKHVTLVEVHQNEQMSKMLEIGRIDGYIVENEVAKTQQLQTQTFATQYAPIEEQDGDPLHYMFSLSVPSDVIESFNRAIEQRQAETR